MTGQIAVPKSVGLLATLVLFWLAASLIDWRAAILSFRMDRALASGKFALPPAEEKQLSEWLDSLHREFGPPFSGFSLNRPLTRHKLNLYTERRKGEWFDSDESYNARYYPDVHAIVLSRDLVAIGVVPYSERSRSAFFMFVLLHELGHSNLHRTKRSSLSFSAYGDPHSPYTTKLEEQADDFAATHLHKGTVVSWDEVGLTKQQAVNMFVGEINVDWYYMCHENKQRLARMRHLEAYMKKMKETKPGLLDGDCWRSSMDNKGGGGR
jgi:hypothetical protein